MIEEGRVTLDPFQRAQAMVLKDIFELEVPEEEAKEQKR